MDGRINGWVLVSWLFFAIFFVIGISNFILVHSVPGIFYLVFSLVYIPGSDDLLKKRVGFSVPILVKVLLFFFVMWGTLGVGDLMEIFEARLR